MCLPVEEGTFGEHEVELVVKLVPGLGDGGGVAQHAHSTPHRGEVPVRRHAGCLVVDANLQNS